MQRASNSLNESPEGRLLALRFGPFELDVRSGELRRNGTTVRLQPQPLKVLLLLAGRPGDVVTREEIQTEIWPAGTFVDFEQSLNFCIRQIRAALRDDANAPRYVETLPRRGYRWVAGPVQPETAPVVVREWPRPLAPEPAQRPAEAGSGETPAAAPPRRMPAHWLVLGSLAALGLLALAALALRDRKPPPPQAPPVFQRVTFRRGAVSSARFGPDGQVVYAADWDGEGRVLFVAHSNPRDSSTLDIKDAGVVGVSASGEVSFLRSGVLARAPLAGGPAKDLLSDIIAADASADGRDFAVKRFEGNHFRIEFPPGHVLAEPPTRQGRLRISPDARHVAFTEHPVLNDDRGRVVIVDRTGRRVATSPDWASLEGLAWVSDGAEVLFTASEAGADNSLRGLALDGTLRRVFSSTGRLVLHDVAPDGRVLLERATVRSEIVFRRAAEKEDRDLSWLDYSAVAGISPSGDTLLSYESGEGGGPEYTTFLRRTDASPPVRLGLGCALDLSPDGQLVLSVDIRNPTALDLTPTGPGETRKIRIPQVVAYDDAGFLADSRRVFITGREASGQRATWLTDLDGKDPRKLPLPEGIYLRQSTFSSDGSHFIAPCTEGGSSCRYDTALGQPTPVAGSEKGWVALGTDSRGRIFYRVWKSGSPNRLVRLDPATGRATQLAELVPRDRAGAFGVRDVAVTANGEVWAYTLMRRLSDLHVVTGIH